MINIRTCRTSRKALQTPLKGMTERKTEKCTLKIRLQKARKENEKMKKSGISSPHNETFQGPIRPVQQLHFIIILRFIPIRLI